MRIAPALFNESSIRGLMKRNPASTPGVLLVANRRQKGVEICCHTFVFLSSAPFTTDVTSSAWKRARRASGIPSPCWKSRRACSAKAIWPPGFAHSIARHTKGRSSTSFGKGGAASAIPLRCAIRETVLETRFHSGSPVPLAQGGFPITRSYRSLCSSPTEWPKLPSVLPSSSSAPFTRCSTLPHPRSVSNRSLSTGLGLGSSSINSRYRPKAVKRSAASLMSKPTICL